VYDVSLNFIEKIRQGYRPIPYVVIETDMGTRIFAKKELGIYQQGIYLADGTQMADGGIMAGGQVILNSGDTRILSIGDLVETVSVERLDEATASQVHQQNAITIDFDNADLYFSKLVNFDPFLTKSIVYRYAKWP
jgi:hypothetical protein